MSGASGISGVLTNVDAIKGELDALKERKIDLERQIRDVHKMSLRLRKQLTAPYRVLVYERLEIITSNKIQSERGKFSTRSYYSTVENRFNLLKEAEFFVNEQNRSREALNQPRKKIQIRSRGKVLFSQPEGIRMITPEEGK